MPEDRAAEVRQFYEAQNATRLHILSVVTPFRPAQDRFVLLERDGAAMLITCGDCPFRAPLTRGEPQPVAPGKLEEFLKALAPLMVETLDDHFPDGMHDGTTVVFERLDGDGYVQIAMMNPPKNSRHAKLVGVWQRTFPTVRAVLRG